LDLAKVNTKEASLKLIEDLKADSGSEWNKFLETHDPAKAYMPERFKYSEHAWKWLQRFYQGRKAAFTKRLLDAGYDAVFDDTDSIFNGETQLIVLNTGMLTEVTQTAQGDTGYKVVEQARQVILKALKNYEGKLVSSPRPKKKRGFGHDPAYIECSIMFGAEPEERQLDSGSKYEVYHREVRFKIETRTHSMSSRRVRPATEVHVYAEGKSKAYSKVFQNNWNEGYRPMGPSWRLEEFKPEELDAFVHKTMKMLWDDDEPAREHARFEEMQKQWAKKEATSAAMPTGFTSTVDMADVRDAYNYAYEDIAPTINYDLPSFIEEDDGFTLPFKPQAMHVMNPGDLIDLSAFTKKPAGWLKSVPESDWDKALEDEYARPYDYMLRLRKQNKLPPAITLNGVFGDGRGRALLQHALGEQIPVVNFEFSK
jgi:hypothetical protein